MGRLYRSRGLYGGHSIGRQRGDPCTKKVVKYLEAIELINEAERDDEKGSEPAEIIGTAYEKAEAAWEDIPTHPRKGFSPPRRLPWIVDSAASVSRRIYLRTDPVPI